MFQFAICEARLHNVSCDCSEFDNVEQLALFLQDNQINCTLSMFLLSNLLIYFVFCRVHPSKDWIQSQIPEIVQNGINGLGAEMGDVDEMDAEAFVQAQVNIVVGSCISIGRLSFVQTNKVIHVPFCLFRLPLLPSVMILVLGLAS